MERRLWCEVGIWNTEPGLMIQVEEFEPDGDYREFVDVLVDMPLEFPAGWSDESDMLELPWEAALEGLGYVTAKDWERADVSAGFGVLSRLVKV